MEKDELSEDEGFYELFFKHQILAQSYSKVRWYQPWILGRKEYLGSECILSPSSQLHTTTVSRDIYLKSMAVCKIFFVCHSTMNALYEIPTLKRKFSLTAQI